MVQGWVRESGKGYFAGKAGLYVRNEICGVGCLGLRH